MYQLTEDHNTVIRMDDGACIPLPPRESEGFRYAKWLAEGNTPQPVPGPSAVDLFQAASMAAQQRLDNFARERWYDGILSLCSYSTDPDPVYSAEGQAGVLARSKTWGTLRAIRDSVISGQRQMPTSWAEIESELPPLVWD